MNTLTKCNRVKEWNSGTAVWNRGPKSGLPEDHYYLKAVILKSLKMTKFPTWKKMPILEMAT